MKKVQCMQSTQIFLRRTSIIMRKRQAYTITYVYVIQRIKEKISISQQLKIIQLQIIIWNMICHK